MFIHKLGFRSDHVNLTYINKGARHSRLFAVCPTQKLLERQTKPPPFSTTVTFKSEPFSAALAALALSGCVAINGPKRWPKSMIRPNV